MGEGTLDAAPVWSDLSTFNAAEWAGAVDLLVAGFPCQPVSVAGKGAGVNDPRWLWPHVLRVLRETEASAIFLENVPGIVGKGLRPILEDLAALGFDAEWGCLDAGAVGATHLRDRWFCLAYSRRGTPRWIEQVGQRRGSGTAEPQPEGEVVAYSNSDGLEVVRRCGVFDGERETHGHDTDGCGSPRGSLGNPDELGQQQPDNEERTDSRREHARVCAGGTGFPPLPTDTEGWRQWSGPQPAVCRDADGIAGRLHRLRMLGNGVVPQQATRALQTLCRRIVDGT